MESVGQQGRNEEENTVMKIRNQEREMPSERKGMKASRKMENKIMENTWQRNTCMSSLSLR